MSSPVLLPVDTDEAARLREAVALALDSLRSQEGYLPSATYSQRYGVLRRAAVTLARVPPVVRSDDLDDLRRLLDARSR